MVLYVLAVEAACRDKWRLILMEIGNLVLVC